MESVDVMNSRIAGTTRKCVLCDKILIDDETIVKRIIVHYFDDHQSNLSFLDPGEILLMAKRLD